MSSTPTTLSSDDNAEAYFIRRAALLAFGVFGIGSDRSTLREGGSGIFIHPYLGLTARHVAKHLFALDTRCDWPPRERFLTQYGSRLFQHLDPLGLADRGKRALWHVTHTWDSALTDVSAIQVAP